MSEMGQLWQSRRGQPAALADLAALSRIRVRQEREAAAWGVWRVAGWSFVLSALAVAGYRRWLRRIGQ